MNKCYIVLIFHLDLKLVLHYDRRMKKPTIEEFNLPEGKRIARKYIVQNRLGAGWEGEVYLVQEMHTNVIRAAKLFYPHRNIKFKTSTKYIQKLHKLQDVTLVMNYQTQDIIRFKGENIVCMICEFIDGEMLSSLLARQKGKRLGVFQALHLLYALVKGIESIHEAGEYHGDLHVDNVMIKRFGLSFDLRVIDLHHWGDSKSDNRAEDLIKIIHIFYECLGGAKHYQKLPPAIKNIIKGLKRSLILKQFKSVGHLRLHLENLDWDYDNL